MTLPPGAWAPIYAIQLLLPSLALACLGVHQPRALAGSRLSRFLIGFCITPFVLGVWMLVVAAALPGSPRWLFLLPPSGMAVALLVVYGPRTARRIVRGCERTRRFSQPSWPIYVSYSGALVVLAMVVYKLAVNSQPPVVAHDALIYLGEALAFAEQRSIDAAATFRGWATGTTQGSTHNFVFPAYLSHALMTTGNNPLGYPYDYAVRAAFQATFIYMAMSAVALGGIVKYPGTGALTLLLTLQVPQMGLISSQDSRDAFRIIPLLLLAVVLAHQSPRRLRHGIPFVRLIPLLILAAFAISGHTLGGIATVTLVLAWVAWAIVGKAKWLSVLLVVAAIGVGMLAGGLPYLNAYIETGQFSGYIATDYAVHNTPLENLLHMDPVRLAAETALLRRLGALLERSHYGLPIIASAAAMLALAGWSRYNQDRRARLIPFIGLMALAGLLPFFGALDIGYQYSVGFVMNARYALHWFPFAGACIAAMAGYWFLNFKSHPNRYLRTLAVVSFALLTVAATGLSGLEVTMWRAPSASEEYLHRRIDNLRLVTRSLSTGERLLLADDRYSYYLDNQAVAMYTRPTWEIVQAKNEGEVRDALAKMNIGAVALDVASIRGWWDQIPLYAYLDNPDNAVLVAGGVFAVYRLVESAAERDRLLDETLRKVNVYDMPASYVVRAIDAGYLNGYENRFLPYEWRGPNTITMRELADVAPPLTRLSGRSDFTFSRVSTERGIVIRVAPDPRGTVTNETVVLFGLQIKDTGGLHIGPGQTVVLSLSARLSDSADKAAILIEDRTYNWQISETQMSGGTWQHYAVARSIRLDATTVMLGVKWQPNGGGQWLEIEDMRVFIVPAQAETKPQETDDGADTP